MITRDIPKNRLYGPLKLCLAWFVFIFSLYLLGPIGWKLHNFVPFVFFLFTYHLSFAFGYMQAIERAKISKIIISEAKLVKYLKVLVYINFAFTFVAAFRYANLSTLSIKALYQAVLYGIYFAGDAYKEAHESKAIVGGSLFPMIHVLLSPILISVYPLALYYFHKLSKVHLFVVVLTLLFEIARWLAIGTNKGVFDIVLYTLAIFFLKYLEGRRRIHFSLSRNNIIRTSLVLLLIYGALSLFGSNISSRTGRERVIDIIGVSSNANYRPNSIFTFFGNESFKVTIFSLDSYLTQGYYAMSRAITEPFSSTYGIGHSVFLLSNIQPDVMERSYQAKLEPYGIDRWVNWHSVYVWWANDVSFWGVIIVMFIWGYYLGALYKDIRYTRNPVSIVLFTLMFIWLFYSSANNQIMAFPFQAMAFIVLTIYWFTKRNIRIGN